MGWGSEKELGRTHGRIGTPSEGRESVERWTGNLCRDVEAQVTNKSLMEFMRRKERNMKREKDEERERERER